MSVLRIFHSPARHPSPRENTCGNNVLCIICFLIPQYDKMFGTWYVQCVVWEWVRFAKYCLKSLTLTFSCPPVSSLPLSLSPLALERLCARLCVQSIPTTHRIGTSTHTNRKVFIIWHLYYAESQYNLATSRENVLGNLLKLWLPTFNFIANRYFIV